MILNSTDVALATAAIWAHPQGVAYLAKIAQIDLLLPGWMDAHRGSTGAWGTWTPLPRPRRRPREEDEALLIALLH